MSEGLHAYIDESVQGDYLVVAACLPMSRVGDLRTSMRGLLIGRQRAIHMKDETKTDRRDLILGTILEFGCEVRVYDAKPSAHGGHAKARSACLARLAADAVNLGVRHMILDRNDAAEQRDKSAIIQGASRTGATRVPFEYHHLPRHAEPLLWVPDAVGWSWAKGGRWKKRVAPLVNRIPV